MRLHVSRTRIIRTIISRSQIVDIDRDERDSRLLLVAQSRDHLPHWLGKHCRLAQLCSTSPVSQQSQPIEHNTISNPHSRKMSFQRAGLRLSQQFRAPVFRRTVQRRFESSHPGLPSTEPGAKLVGPQDNAFNRERAAVKAHAAATSGEQMIWTLLMLWPSANATTDLWRRLSI